MSFKVGCEYAKDTVFTQEALLRVTPEDICQWMNADAFGDPTPSSEMKPLEDRSTTLLFREKTLSSFMPRINFTWDPIRCEGNPTRAELINQLIQCVKRFEVRQERVESQSRCAIEIDEFLILLSLVHQQRDKGATRFLVGSVLTLQWHWMARIDDMMKFSTLSPNIQTNDATVPNALV
ncbi:hypothetical protein BBJ28_00002526 [Nothophytophthora sp. Chile5]|nr:hypothetical protein BBJ28_00002526 [Nothophytophthora sp. Chile5]